MTCIILSPCHLYTIIVQGPFQWRSFIRNWNSIITVSLTMFTQPFFSGADQENIKAPRHWPLCGEFHAQMASSAENVSIWWRHHDRNSFCCNSIITARQITTNICTCNLQQNLDKEKKHRIWNAMKNVSEKVPRFASLMPGCIELKLKHYSDVMMSVMASQITDVWTVCSGAHKKPSKLRASGFVRGNHRWPADSSHKGQ